MPRLRTGKIIVCPTCGRSRYLKPYAAQRQVYCSIPCRPPVWNKGKTVATDPRINKYVTKVAQANRGKRRSVASEFKKGDPRISGAGHWNWKGGVNVINKGIRAYYNSLGEYRNLRREVLRRDNYTCQLCGVRGGVLHVDHIKAWAKFPELRLDKSNCRTLCYACHIKTPNYGGKTCANICR